MKIEVLIKHSGALLPAIVLRDVEDGEYEIKAGETGGRQYEGMVRVSGVSNVPKPLPNPMREAGKYQHLADALSGLA